MNANNKSEIDMADIKLFVCCHQPAQVPEHPLLIPVQVGAALSEVRFPNFLQDDMGINISNKNRSYCELTAQYWAWKNVDADFYGFFHYRRYLCPLVQKRPYCIARFPAQSILEKLGYCDFSDFIRRYDVILPQKENMYLSVRSHYSSAKYHHKEDLDLVEKIVQEKNPEYVEPLNDYLSGSMCYFGNIFIMKKRIFLDYCSWLFPILEVFDRRQNTVYTHPQEQRVDGYLAERLLGGYAKYLQTQGLATIGELPRVHFIPNRANFCRTKVENFLFPPGTYRRAAVKQFISKARQALGDSL